LQQREEYHGGAVLWSPCKVREANIRQNVTDQEEHQEKLAKANRKELREVAKLQKEIEKEERRVAAAEKKVEREKEKAEKAAKQEREKQERHSRQAQSLTKLSSKGQTRATYR
jgi:predicted  nucleic acid-binding Zn-ribbon protein